MLVLLCYDMQWNAVHSNHDCISCYILDELYACYDDNPLPMGTLDTITQFHALPTTASFAPGRVNLIGKLINSLTC